MTANIAVIGAGPAGLASMKCLKDEGFAVTGFERRPEAGGVWTFSEDPRITTTIPNTKAQLMKYASSMSDYPFPDDYPIHISAEQWSRYFISYAKHFDIYKAIVFGRTATCITRNQDDTKWLVFFDEEDAPREFDKVVWATGSETVAKHAEIDGLENFAGKFMHSQAFKHPEEFRGMNVVVLGIGNSAGDVAVDLVPHAAKVYLVHRRGLKVIPRTVDGTPFDNAESWSSFSFNLWLERFFPRLFRRRKDRASRALLERAWGTDSPARAALERSSPSTAHGLGAVCINDDLVPLVDAGRIEVLSGGGGGLRRVAGPRALELADGRILDDIDAVVACTGYRPDFAPLVAGGAVRMVPPQPPPPPGPGPVPSPSPPPPPPPPLPDLYMNVFSPEHAHSLACTSHVALEENTPTTRELAAMAVAQIWAGKSATAAAALPSPDAMRRAAAAHRRWWAAEARACPAHYAAKQRGHAWSRFVHAAAGTAMWDHVGWLRWRAWRLWWRDAALYRLVARGVLTPHLYRLFETGGRPAWEGAEEAVRKVNEERDRRFGGGKKQRGE